MFASMFGNNTSCSLVVVSCTFYVANENLTEQGQGREPGLERGLGGGLGMGLAIYSEKSLICK